MGHHRTRRNEACHRFYQDNHATHPTGMYNPNNAGQIRFQVDPNPVQAAPLVGHIPPSSSSEDISDASMDDSGQEEGNDGFPVPDDDEFVPLYQPEQTEREPNTTMREQFYRYVASANHNYVHLQPEYAAGIELMSILDKEGAPLTAYDKIMEWHVQNLDTARKKVTQQELMSRLRARYNMTDLRPYPVRTVLPYSKVVLDVPCHDAGAMIRDLLTDPRIMESDYLFFDDEPARAPPADHEWMELRDINTGLAYRETYEALIRPKPTTDSGRTKVLIPIIPYMDSCVTGEFNNLSLEILKITLGIFKYKARDKGSHWRNLGAVPTYQKEKSKAREMISKSGHKDALMYLSDSDDEATVDTARFMPDFDVFDYINTEEDTLDAMLDPQIPETNAQDLHTILHTILASYKQIQSTGGIEWDLYYKGKLHYLQFIPFIPYIKGDGVEHDKHCGKYGSRTKGVKQLCRHCCCPNKDTDEAYVDHDRKTQPMMTELVRLGKASENDLKELSQKLIWNAWYELRFGLHNDWGVHGATPMELIHWIQLGMFKYSRDMLFEQTGKGKLGENVNNVATQMGWLFQRQSNKNEFPRTKFTRGVMKGKLMAHEFSGIMLVLAASLRSSKGRKAILEPDSKTKAQMEFFPNAGWVYDWIMLLETQLQFLSWLQLPSMLVTDVKRMDKKVRELMEMTKQVGKRKKGMAFKTMNFHGIKHVPDDILNFGVPSNVDTKSDEMHHKDDKKSAKRTQKRPKTFDIQALGKIEDRRVIEFGMEELAGRPRWHYYKGFRHPETPDEAPMGGGEPTLSGVEAIFRFDVAEGEGSDQDCVYRLETEMKSRHRYRYTPNVVETVGEVLYLCDPHLNCVSVFSELVMPSGQTYRAAPYFQGKPWFDWAYFDHDDAPNNANLSHIDDESEGTRFFPGHIRGFVDLTRLPDNNNTQYDATIYCIMEPTELNLDEKELEVTSELFRAFLKKQYLPRGASKMENRLQLMPIRRLVGPCCVIPDLENHQNCAFLRVQPPSKWADLFRVWLRDPHSRQFSEPQSRDE